MRSRSSVLAGLMTLLLASVDAAVAQPRLPPSPGAGLAESPPPLPSMRRAEPPPLPAAARRPTPPPLPGGAARSAPPTLPVSANPVQGAQTRGTTGAGNHASDIEHRTLRLVRRDFHDNLASGGTIVAFSMLLPHDWRVRGDVLWNGSPGTPSCHGTRDAQLYLSAESADGRWGFYVNPGAQLAWVSAPDASGMLLPGMPPPSFLVETALQEMRSRAGQPGSLCRVTPETTMTELAERVYLPAVRPGARVLEVTEMPDVVDALRRQLSVIEQGSAGPRQQPFAVSYRVAIESPAGPLEEEHLIIASRMQTPFPVTGYGDGAAVELTGFPVFVSRFPRGRREEAEAVIGFLARTLRSNPRWDAALAEHRRAMTQIAIDGARDRSRIIAETSAHISDLQMEGWRTRSASADRMSALTSDAMREVTPLRDPATGREHELPSHYSTFYANANGEFLMSTDPSFRASEAFPHEAWTRLEANPR